MRAVLEIIMLALDLYIWIVIAMVVFSWLYAFRVINTSNQFVAAIGNFLHQATEPLLGPIRRVMPNLGGLDVSPIVLFLGIYFVQRVIQLYIYPNVF